MYNFGLIFKSITFPCQIYLKLNLNLKLKTKLKLKS